MPFKARPHTHRVEASPTGRARCRRCKARLEKGATRVATRAFVMPGRSTVFVRCLRCVALDRSFRDAARDAHGDVESVPCAPSVSAVEAALARAALAASPPPQRDGSSRLSPARWGSVSVSALAGGARDAERRSTSPSSRPAASAGDGAAAAHRARRRLPPPEAGRRAAS